MPVPMLKSFADKYGKSISELERYWDNAKAQAAKEGKADNYAYIVGIVKKRAGITESKFGQILNIINEVRSICRLHLNRKTKKFEFLNRYGLPPSIAGHQFDSKEEALKAARQADLQIDEMDFEPSGLHNANY